VPRLVGALARGVPRPLPVLRPRRPRRPQLVLRRGRAGPPAGRRGRAPCAEPGPDALDRASGSSLPATGGGAVAAAAGAMAVGGALALRRAAQP
jgi:hypothetical protein